MKGSSFSVCVLPKEPDGPLFYSLLDPSVFGALESASGLELATLAKPPVSSLPLTDTKVIVFFEFDDFIILISVNSDARSFIVSRPFGSNGVTCSLFPSDSGYDARSKFSVSYFLASLNVVAFLICGLDCVRGDGVVRKVSPSGLLS